ncbi:hypothetical protein BBC0122_018190 [Bartonella choladocola]|uniref:Uncharacterized protein n=1 Tax=Bartonella choladocola TaxID=2750995 RepID=A0A1U9MIY1_9HYPH|nr:hypothetical protein [Bartonella choladocola]AQT47917.1 hypothetical protein BBC0122_018190 [Bartonella choladocola]
MGESLFRLQLFPFFAANGPALKHPLEPASLWQSFVKGFSDA